VIRLVVTNQRGGVGKTTTAINYACYLAQRNYRTLLIDTDPQGSVGIMLGLLPDGFLSHCLLQERTLPQCVMSAQENLDVLCSNKQTVEAELRLSASASPQTALTSTIGPFEDLYSAVVLDVSPSIGLLQTCAMVYARRVLLPVNMDLLSLNAANAVCDTVRVLNDWLSEPILVVGLMPCQVHKGLSITHLAEEGLQTVSAKFGVPVLPAVRTDQSVNRAFTVRQPLLAFDPTSRAAQDYVAVFDRVTANIENSETQHAKGA
jgi:chromosome partitioning protein